METIRIGICDDEDFFREELEKLVSVYGNDAEHDFDIHTYSKAEDVATDILEKNEEYHILFLDVEMDGMTGMEVAQKLRREGYKGVICFVSSKDRYAFDAFGVDAIGYVKKPAKYQDVKRIVQKALVQIYYQRDEEEAKKRYLEITTQNEKTMLDLQQVLYVEKRRNQCVIHMEESEIVCYETLKKLYERLDKTKFSFTHQGFIVNFDKIKEVKKDTVCFGAGREIPVSRRYQAELRERHINKIYRIRKERSKN
ncbi:MAG: response regulator transcription factor [Agathobacter sp.]|nr:response regulator transcription factor [Agathobacter sp.]